MIRCLVLLTLSTTITVHNAFLSNRETSLRLRKTKENLFERYHPITTKKESIFLSKQRLGKSQCLFQKMLKRKDFLLLSPSVFVSSTIFKKAAHGGGLVQFPCVNGLVNTYHFMRAGENLFEENNELSTNPLFITEREAALSSAGVTQIQESCKRLINLGVNPSFVLHSLASKSMDTAEIVVNELMITRDRCLPEYSFLDPRAIGLWDMLPLDSTEAAVWSLDVEEAGKYGKAGRPPAHDNSTPHETLGDQAIRLRQLLSVLETQRSGDTVLLIFPDGTGPALLTCLINDIPLNRVHEFEFEPGEFRLNVGYGNAPKSESYSEKVYLDKINYGKTQLDNLRKNEGNIISSRDTTIFKNNGQQQTFNVPQKQEDSQVVPSNQTNREIDYAKKRDSLPPSTKQKYPEIIGPKDRPNSRSREMAYAKNRDSLPPSTKQKYPEIIGPKDRPNSRNREMAYAKNRDSLTPSTNQKYPEIIGPNDRPNYSRKRKIETEEKLQRAPKKTEQAIGNNDWKKKNTEMQQGNNEKTEEQIANDFGNTYFSAISLLLAGALVAHKPESNEDLETNPSPDSDSPLLNTLNTTNHITIQNNTSELNGANTSIENLQKPPANDHNKVIVLKPSRKATTEYEKPTEHVNNEVIHLKPSGRITTEVERPKADINDKVIDMKISGIKTEEENLKKEIAQKAMEDYLNKDDGVDEWLSSINEIISE